MHTQAWSWAVLTSQVNCENHQQFRSSSRVNSSSEIFNLLPTRGAPSVSGQVGTSPTPISMLGSSPLCTDGLNNTAGETARTLGITLRTGPQSPDGPRTKPGAIAEWWGRAVVRAPTTDTGHSHTHGCSLHKAVATSSRRAPHPLHSQGKHSPTHRDRGMDKMVWG